MANYPRKYPHETGAGTGSKVDKYRYEYFPIWAYGNYYALAEDTYGSEDILVSAGGGAPSVGEVHTTTICGLHIDAEGDDVGIYIPIPYDMDVKYPLGFRCHWVTTTDGTDACTWTVKYTEITTNGEALAAGATALTTAIAADTSTGQYYVNVTAWGELTGGTLTNGRGLSLLVEATDCAAAAGTGLYLLGLEMRYTRRII
jgi:hypothetical protein